MRAFVNHFTALLTILTAAVDPLSAEAPLGKERLPGHHNLFNGDCTFLFQESFVKDPTAKYEAATLDWFIGLLAENGVDTYLLNPNAQLPWYPSRRTPNILTGYRRGDVEFFRGHFQPDLPKKRLEQAMAEQARFLDRYLDLADAGVNWVEEISKACRRRNMSPWLSIRMNDMHGANSWEGSYMNNALQRDPRYRLSGRQPNPRDPVNRMEQSLNYAMQEVRDYMLLMIRELVEDYDFEGLELDWLRCPFCLDPPASEEGVALMTRWIAEIRALTRSKADRTGKAYPLGMRIPCRLGLCKAVGLDVKTMARSGLIDFVCLSNSWQTTWDVPYDEIRHELGDQVAIYGVIEDAPNWLHASSPEGKTQWLPSRLLSASPELLRGNAAGKLALGTDGIETFNFFCTDEGPHDLEANGRQARYSVLRDLEKLNTLRGQEKHYALASMQGRFMFPIFELAEQVPAFLEPEWKKAFRLSMCAEPADSELELIVQLVVEKSSQMPDLAVSFNGSWPSFEGVETEGLLFPAGVYTHHVPEHRAFNFRFRATDIKEGWNEVLVFNGSHERATAEERHDYAVTIVSIELGVKRPAASE